MAAINDKALAKFKGILEVRPYGSTGAFERLASVRGLVANLDTTNVIDIKADDTGSVFKITDVQASIEAELLENADRDVLALLFTWNTSNIAWVSTNVVWEALGTGWTVATPIKLAKKNWDNTIVTTITIKEDWVALVSGTDYKAYVSNGDTYILPLTAQTWVITADYTYLPNASEDITITIDSTEVKSFEVKITAIDNWKMRIITRSKASFSSTYWLTFTDVIASGDITWATITFTADKGSTVLFHNEIL